MLSIWCVANRFEHTEVTRHDPVLKRLFGFKQMANFKAIMRLFRKFSQADNERIANTLYSWQFGQLGIDGLALDLDSTVMTRYGTQEDTARGYNPSKPGRASHHPLMAFVAKSRLSPIKIIVRNVKQSGQLFLVRLMYITYCGVD